MPPPDPVQQFPEGRGRWHGCGQGKCPRGGAAQAVKPLLTTLLRLEPDFNVRSFVGTYPFAREEDREAYEKGLLLAGAPRG